MLVSSEVYKEVRNALSALGAVFLCVPFVKLLEKQS